VYEQGDEKVPEEITALFEKIEKNDPAVEEMIDWDNFIDYIFVQAFFMNEDWPQNNIRMIGGKGVKWKFVLYDMDLSMAYSGNRAGSDINLFKRLAVSSTRPGKLFRRLLDNKIRMEQLVQRFDELLDKTFSAQKLITVFETCRSQVAGDMKYHIQRWGRPETLAQWSMYVEQNREFILGRTSYFAAHYKTQLDQCANL
jgi:hypothetical protein